MINEEFIEIAKEKVRDYENARIDINFINLQLEDIFVLYSIITLQKFRTLLSAKHKNAYYYEFTYDRDKNQMYMGVYSKIINIKIKP